MKIERHNGIGAFAALLCLALSACLLAPGKFVSTLDVRRDGTFTYSYTGGIYLMPLAMPNSRATFSPAACQNDETLEERPCTEEELARQKSDFEKQQAEKNESDAKAAQLLFGGINPNDPKAAEEIAGRLRRQKGWRRVDYKGGGLFDVEFLIAGKLDHDFTFPTIERFPMANAFVQVALRDDGTVRVDAPGFGPSLSGPVMAGMMQGAMMKDGGEGQQPPSSADGTFTIRTDAAILANNTDEGPRKAAGGQELGWTVNARVPAAPMALLRTAP